MILKDKNSHFRIKIAEKFKKTQRHFYDIISDYNAHCESFWVHLYFLVYVVCYKYVIIFLIKRFINARRRIVQPLIDQSNRAGAPGKLSEQSL